MGQITADQSQQVMATLMANVDWKSIDFDGSKLQDAIIRDPKGAGKRFEGFLKNGCQFVIGEMRKLALPESFDPAVFFKSDEWAYWRGPLNGDGLTGEMWIDPRAAAMTELDSVDMIFKTCLKSGKSSIKGFEKFRRLVEDKTDFIRFDLRFFAAILKDWQEMQENSILEMLYQTQKVEYLDFMVPLRGPAGICYVLCLCRDSGGGWDWNCHWLDFDWDAHSLSVGCASSPRNLESQG